ncbi:MAG: 2-C-methyl-D-erythritol 2,4-cyclodiphosphate synthase [Candidatus Marinimicrobia bacterium]|nr:2-C-methyl-D-erythritol 2,4-cyclodiphosphate synthase [Candidatus Neomarinimicrobiota bacterium]
MRIGNGYDTHPLIDGRKLILGGVHIPYKKGVDGHSDGDVLTHAIMDSLLGAMAEKDIGHLFPPNKNNHNISSMELLKKVVDILHNKKFMILNIDTTVILESPKIASYISKIREALACRLKTNIDKISVKATTNDKLGFIGKGKGVSALSSCLIIKND